MKETSGVIASLTGGMSYTPRLSVCIHIYKSIHSRYVSQCAAEAKA